MSAPNVYTAVHTIAMERMRAQQAKTYDSAYLRALCISSFDVDAVKRTVAIESAKASQRKAMEG